MAISGKAKLKNQRAKKEGFYILICHFDFLSLIFDFLQDLVLSSLGFNLGIASSLPLLAMTGGVVAI